MTRIVLPSLEQEFGTVFTDLLYSGTSPILHESLEIIIGVLEILLENLGGIDGIRT